MKLWHRRNTASQSSGQQSALWGRREGQLPQTQGAGGAEPRAAPPCGVVAAVYGKYPGYEDFVEGASPGAAACQEWSSVRACLQQFRRSGQSGDVLAELASLPGGGGAPQGFTREADGTQLVGYSLPSHDRPDASGQRCYPITLVAAGADLRADDPRYIGRAIEGLASAANAMLKTPPVYAPRGSRDDIPGLLGEVARDLAAAMGARTAEQADPASQLPSPPWPERWEMLALAAGGEAQVGRVLMALLGDRRQGALPPLGLWHSQVEAGRALRLPVSAQEPWQSASHWRELLRTVVGPTMPIYVFHSPDTAYVDIVFHGLTGAAFQHIFAPLAAVGLTTEQGAADDEKRQVATDALLAKVRRQEQHRPSLVERCRHYARNRMGRGRQVGPPAVAEADPRGTRRRLSLRQMARSAPRELALAALVTGVIVLLVIILLWVYASSPSAAPGNGRADPQLEAWQTFCEEHTSWVYPLIEEVSRPEFAALEPAWRRDSNLNGLLIALRSPEAERSSPAVLAGQRAPTRQLRRGLPWKAGTPEAKAKEDDLARARGWHSSLKAMLAPESWPALGRTLAAAPTYRKRGWPGPADEIERACGDVYPPTADVSARLNRFLEVADAVVVAERGWQSVGTLTESAAKVVPGSGLPAAFEQWSGQTAAAAATVAELAAAMAKVNDLSGTLCEGLARTAPVLLPERVVGQERELFGATGSALGEAAFTRWLELVRASTLPPAGEWLRSVQGEPAPTQINAVRLAFARWRAAALQGIDGRQLEGQAQRYVELRQRLDTLRSTCSALGERVEKGFPVSPLPEVAAPNLQRTVLDLPDWTAYLTEDRDAKLGAVLAETLPGPALTTADEAVRALTEGNPWQGAVTAYADVRTRLLQSREAAARLAWLVDSGQALDLGADEIGGPWRLLCGEPATRIGGLTPLRKALQQIQRLSAAESATAMLQVLEESPTRPVAVTRSAWRLLRAKAPAQNGEELRAEVSICALQGDDTAACIGELLRRWQQAVDRLGSADAVEGALALLHEGLGQDLHALDPVGESFLTGVRNELTPRSRFNVLMALARSESAQLPKEAGAWKAWRERLREQLGQLPQSMAREETVVQVQQILASGESDTAGSGSSPLQKVGPASVEGWTLTSASGGAAEYHGSVDGEEFQLAFIAVTPTEGQPRAYLCRGELPVGLLVAVLRQFFGADPQMGKLLQDGFDARKGVRTWTLVGSEPLVAPAWFPRNVRTFDGQLAGFYPAGREPPPPASGHPAQYVPLWMALRVAAALGCRLQTYAEWQAAVAVGRESTPNLAGLEFGELLNHYEANVKANNVPHPAKDGFHGSDGPWQSADTTARDGIVWFDVTDSGKAAFQHLVGNVAEYVLVGPAATSTAPAEFAEWARKPDPAAELRQAAVEVRIAGGSALLPPRADLDLNKAVDAPIPDGGIDFGYSDVGIRLAFSAPPPAISEGILPALQKLGFIPASGP